MSPQADYVVSNGTGAAVRSDINGQLAAIVSNNSGASAPATTYAYMLWADTSTNLLKLRNGANSAWITVGDLTAANLGLAALASPTFTGTATIPTLTVSTAANIPLGSAASPTLYFTGDSNTGLYSPGADQVALSTGGTGRLFIDSSGRCGIGTSSPSTLIHGAVSSGSAILRLENTANSGESSLQLYGKNSGGTVRTANIKYDNSDYFRIGTPAAVAIAFETSDTERLRITSAGNVGIGTSTPQHLLDCTSIGRFTGNTNSAASGAGIEIGYDSGNTTGFIQSYNRGSSTYLSTAVDGSDVRLKINGAEKARIDSSGRLLVGTSSTSATIRAVFAGGDGGGSVGNVQIANTGNSLTDGQGLGTLGFVDSDHSSGKQDYARITGARDGGTWSSTSKPTRLVFSTTADGASSPTERMRIGQNGAVNTFNGIEGLYVRTSNPTNNADPALSVSAGATNTQSGTRTFYAAANGNCFNQNSSYGGISDIKLKENIVDATTQWNDIKSLQVRKYNFKEETGQQTHTQIGLIAQEVELVSPGLVSESPDRDEDGNDLGTVTKSVNYSVLYMKAVKALQEAMERIETLEAKVAALESA